MLRMPSGVSLMLVSDGEELWLWGCGKLQRSGKGWCPPGTYSQRQWPLVCVVRQGPGESWGFAISSRKNSGPSSPPSSAPIRFCPVLEIRLKSKDTKLLLDRRENIRLLFAAIHCYCLSNILWIDRPQVCLALVVLIRISSVSNGDLYGSCHSLHQWLTPPSWFCHSDPTITYLIAKAALISC